MPASTAAHPPEPPDLALATLLVRVKLDAGNDVERSARLLALAGEILKNDAAPDAPLRQLLVRLGDCWSPLLLFVLSTGRYRFRELRRTVDALSELSQDTKVSQRMLTLCLRTLERDGLIDRHVGPQRAATVDYGLTPMGSELMRIVETLVAWCVDSSERIRQARRTFDAQEAVPANTTIHRLR